MSTQIKERGLLFQAQMVCATLNGSKTQTRRTRGLEFINESPDDFAFIRVQDGYPDGRTRYIFEQISDGEPGGYKCPYGEIGDRLWVKETHHIFSTKPVGEPIQQDAVYRADSVSEMWDVKWRPSIFMPRWASRITLEITDIRVERVQEISIEDVLAEGIERDPDEANIGQYWREKTGGKYAALWDSINGAGAWDENPWVWVVEFKRV